MMLKVDANIIFNILGNSDFLAFGFHFKIMNVTGTDQQINLYNPIHFYLIFRFLQSKRIQIIRYENVMLANH